MKVKEFLEKHKVDVKVITHDNEYGYNDDFCGKVGIEYKISLNNETYTIDLSCPCKAKYINKEFLKYTDETELVAYIEKINDNVVTEKPKYFENEYVDRLKPIYVQEFE